VTNIQTDTHTTLCATSVAIGMHAMWKQIVPISYSPWFTVLHPYQ